MDRKIKQEWSVVEKGNNCPQIVMGKKSDGGM
jgi:hypothetical protein